MTLELLHAQRLEKCVPVLMGKELEEPDQATGSTVGRLFDAQGPGDLPDVVCTSVVDLLRSILSGLAPPVQPSPQLSSRTVRGTVTALTAYLGIKGWDPSAIHGGGYASAEHAKEAFKSSLIRCTVKATIECLASLPPHPPHMSSVPPSPSATPAGQGSGLEAVYQVLVECNLQDKVEAARAWLDEQGLESLRELKAAKMEEDLVRALGLKPGKAREVQAMLEQAELS